MLPTIALGVMAGMESVCVMVTRRSPKPRWVFVLALAATLGGLGYNLAQPHFDSTLLATYNDQFKSVIVEGVIVGEPDARDQYTNLRVEADKPVISHQPTQTVKGLVLVQVPPFTDFRYGDRIRAEGKLQTPTRSSEFDYREYLARQDVYSIMSRPRLSVLARSRFCTSHMVVFVQGARQEYHRADSA